MMAAPAHPSNRFAAIRVAAGRHVRARRADGFECGQGVRGGLAVPDPAPQRVIADRVAGVELAHAIRLAVVAGNRAGLA